MLHNMYLKVTHYDKLSNQPAGASQWGRALQHYCQDGFFTEVGEAESSLQHQIKGCSTLGASRMGAKEIWLSILNGGSQHPVPKASSRRMPSELGRISVCAATLVLLGYLLSCSGSVLIICLLTDCQFQYRNIQAIFVSFKPQAFSTLILSKISKGPTVLHY